MKKTLFTLSLLAGLFYALSVPTGCYYDNEEELYGGDTTTCDTANMRYSVEIKQIMQANCYQCHLPGGASYSGIPFETHAQLRAVALNGKLLDRINNTADPMPQTGLMLLCNRQKIEAWVKAGSQDN